MGPLLDGAGSLGGTNFTKPEMLPGSVPVLGGSKTRGDNQTSWFAVVCVHAVAVVTTVTSSKWSE